MARCLSCGRENAEDARVCNGCGEALAAAVHDVRKLATIVFSDVEGSTALGERLDPEAVKGVMSRYFEAMRVVVETHGGAVEKFVGDAVMAAFGIPRVREDDALRAVRAALEMQAAVQRVNEELERRFGVRIAVRTGVNTGEVIAGDPVQEDSFAIGDTVNVAARLEQAAGGGEVLIGEPTYQLVRDAVEVEAVEPLRLKGKAEPLAAYRLLAVREGAPALARRLDVPLVGREPELAELEELLARAERKRRPEVALIVADAGIGKSRLAAEFLSRAEGHAGVLRGRCLPYGEGITFWPVAEMVREAAGLDDEEPPARTLSKIEALLVAERAAATQGVGAALGLVDVELAIEEVYLGIRRLFEALARERALVLLFDDLQWAESALLGFLEHLAQLARAPILLVALARPELLERREDWEERFACLRLGPLSGRESERLAAGLVGGNVEEALLGRVADAAQGNPLFVEEMLRMLVEEGTLERRNGGWAAAGELTELTMPHSIEALLSARLERLEPSQRTVLEAASVIGEVFWAGAVAELAPQVEAVRAELAGLLERQLVVADPTGFAGESGYRFAHILIRDAAYRRLLKETRAAHHERLARWVERRVGARLAEYEEIIGYHLEQAYRYRSELGPVSDEDLLLARRAAELLAAAGRRAFGRGDMLASVKLLERSSALFPVGDRARLELLNDLGYALFEVGELERASSVLEEAMERGRAVGDRGVEWKAAAKLAHARMFTNPEALDTERLIRDATTAIEVLEELDDDLGVARACCLLCDARWPRGKMVAVAEAAQRAAERARIAGSRREEAWGLGAYGLAQVVGPAPAQEAAHSTERMLREAEGNLVLEANLMGFLGVHEAMSGRFEAARVHVAQSCEALSDLGLKWQVGIQELLNGWVELLAGDPVAAERHMRSARDRFIEIGDKWFLADVSVSLPRPVYQQGRYDEALSLVRAIDQAPAPADREWQIKRRGVHARLLAREGRIDEAERLAREGAAIAATTDLLWSHGDVLIDLAEVLRIAGRFAEAADAAKGAVSIYERKCIVPSGSRARALVAELEGVRG